MRSLIFFLSISYLIIAGCNSDEVISIHFAGDSTVANKPYGKGNPEKGWGQVFSLYFEDEVKVFNHGINGRSTKSFIDEGRWEALINEIKAGDYVFIQFGHNDAKYDDSTRYAAPFTDYMQNLTRMVQDVRSMNGNPVLLTSIVRRRFNDDGEFFDTHGDYPGVVRAVAREESVYLIDLHEKSMSLIEQLGPELSKKIYLHIDKNEYAHLEYNIIDDTHLSAIGAFRICDLVVEEINDQIPKLANFLKK